MARRGIAVIALWLVAFTLVIGVSAILARSPGPRAQPVAPVRVPAKIRGIGAAAGNIGETTLHHAHVRGSEPVACRACHDVAVDGFARPDRERCLGCHPARKAALHAAVEAADVIDDKDPRQCTRCHDFLDTRPTADRAWECQECHAQPHSDDMMVSGTTAETCGRCHSPHGDEALAPKACIGCHETQTTAHQTTDDPGTGSCLACHRQHDAKENAIGRCVECHLTKAPRVSAAALFPGGHVTCIGCHTPHTFSKRTVKACTSCHANQVALAAARVGAHRDCRNCHDQHDVATNAQQSCVRCHERVSPKHPKNAHGDACLGCHPPHPRRAETASAAVACSTCHTKAASDRAFHNGARCNDCHHEHDFKLVLQPSLCLGCHAARVGQAAAVAVSTGHGDCTRCHGGQPHAPAAPPRCATCHQPQGATVPKGHADCTSCHDQHSGELKRRAATCTACHPDRKQGPHVAIKGGCQNCHRPHAPTNPATPGALGPPKPPPCATCHRVAELAGLHQQPQHATCTDCHQPHGPPPTTRAACLRCHAAQQTHQPTADSCVGCHPFRRGGP
ncbi:MAG: hypothetical protein IPL61_14600 [Myxococcales bacterium]|nr:hypothetical protein [Myxococcales bacterium]